MQEVEVFEVGGAEALDEFAADGAEKLDGGGGLETGEDADGDAGDADELAGLERDDIGGAGAVIDEGDFAEEVAGFEAGEFDAAIGGRGVDGGAAGEENVEAVALVAGLEDFFVLLERNGVSQTEKGGDFVEAEAGENGEALKAGVVRLDGRKRVLRGWFHRSFES